MTVAFEAGYSLPAGDLPLKHARVLHEGNRHRIKSASASAELASYPATAANIGSTVDRWRPFENAVEAPTDFGDVSWTLLDVTVGVDNQTVAETALSSNHIISTAYAFSAFDHVASFKVKRQTAPEVQVRANDGSTLFTCFFDLRDGTVGTASNCTGQIRSLGGDEFLLSIYFTAVSGTGTVALAFSDGAENISYTGAVTNTIKIRQATAHLSSATLRLDSFGSQEGDVMAIAAHNIGSGSGRITFEHDSDENDTWTSIGTVTPTDDSPVMFLFVPVTSSRWRITVDRGVLPEIGVFRIGKALQMQRTFYGGFSPSRMNRATEILGNLSGTGELLGRSKRRTILQAKYMWENLNYSWVRDNLDGPTGLIQSCEVEPLFLAWRPEVTDDVDYVMRAKADAPQSMGVADMWNFSMGGEVHSYE